MEKTLVRKLSTETLTNRLVRQPFNTTILKELNKRATKIYKCQIEAQKRLDKEKAKYFSKAVLGHKNEYYATEEEMLSTPTYTFESLSDSEKLIWNGKA